MDQFLWTEKYRPHTIEDCILPDHLKKTLTEFVAQKNVPNLIFTGTPGVGKTTAASAICDMIGCDFMLLNGSQERGIDTLRTKITQYASSVSFTGGRKVIIIDEADNMTPDLQSGLRGALEEFAINCSFIFTCNHKARIIEAIHSRCAVIEFKLKNDEKPVMAGQLMKRLSMILNEEGVTFDKKVLAEVIGKHFPDYRRTLNELQRYSAQGSIDIGILAQLSDVTIKELVSYLKNKDFGAMRKWVALNGDMDHAKLYRAIFDGLYEILKPESIPQAVVVLGEWQFRGTAVPDPDINTTAMLTVLMMECDFK